MKYCVLATGSRGNTTFVASSTTKILLDLGTTSMYTEKKLKEIGINPGDIDAILISHTHSDHINGLRVFIKKYNPTLFLSKEMLKDLNNIFNVTNYVLIDDDFSIGDINVSIIKTSHDVSDSNGYILENNSNSIVYITDTGYINQKYEKKLSNKNVYIFESNYDTEMLMHSNKPYYLQQRIRGDKGHLSNDSSAYYLSHYIGKDTKTIILTHLSHDNNTKECALNTLKNKFKEESIEFNNIIVSTQDERTELLEV